MRNLFGLTRGELEQLMTGRGLPPFRGRQIYRAIYARGAQRLESLTDLSRPLRESLAAELEIRRPQIASRHLSADGTVKHLLALEDGRNVETVYIPEPPPRERHTFCLSTQVGCPLSCSFCFSGTIRFERNLTPGEILGQFVAARAALTAPPARSNVVFMGMGEPLLNREAVLKSLEVLTDDEGLGVSPRRITVSTAGLPEEISAFAERAPAVGLAISLHGTTNELRSRIMPINRKYPLEELLAAARRLPLPKRRRITFEYVLLGGENDAPADARRLAALLRGLRAKINLIAYNPWPGSPHERSTSGATSRFLRILTEAGLTVSLRRSRGDDVLAACGQLANRGAGAGLATTL